MIKKILKVLATIGSALLSVWYLFIWTMLFFITGILMLIDWIHWIWTHTRIGWIEKTMNGWRDLFDHPFTRS